MRAFLELPIKRENHDGPSTEMYVPVDIIMSVRPGRGSEEGHTRIHLMRERKDGTLWFWLCELPYAVVVERIHSAQTHAAYDDEYARCEARTNFETQERNR